MRISAIKVVIALMSMGIAGQMWADVKWLATDYNFGAFKEAEGSKKGSVRFVNTGKKATFIRNVRPSCGCTAADFTKEMIEPGDTATVEFVYDPAGRPGPFDKTLRVYVGEDNSLTVIRLTGTVIGSPATLEANYPHEGGSLRYETLLEHFGEVTKGKSRHLFVNIYNQGTDTVRPVWSCGDAALEPNLTPHALAPGEIGTFGFYLNTAKEKRLGQVEYVVKVKPDRNSPKEDERVIRISASIVPDSRGMTVEEIESSPRAYLDPEFVDLGTLPDDSPVTFEFGILNDGKATLKIDRVYSRNEAVELKSFTGKVKGGEKGNVNGTLDISGFPSGPFRVQVEVVTNDPLHPVRIANLVGIKP